MSRASITRADRAARRPGRHGGRQGGAEVYRTEQIEFRAGDCIRWTRNDAGLGLVNSAAAEVPEVRNGRVTFRIEDGRRLELDGNDPQLRHLDHAWTSTVHAFQGRTVDNVIAAMEADHLHLTIRKSFYIEIARVRDRAEPVTDDAVALRERLGSGHQRAHLGARTDRRNPGTGARKGREGVARKRRPGSRSGH